MPAALHVCTSASASIWAVQGDAITSTPWLDELGSYNVHSAAVHATTARYPREYF
jgi:hypothetical protein